ncbi:type II secretion system protein M [Caulobacter zeae]|uniref:Type II secretion system protein M n=1 Tax=Caulobacter zeae TaxID=2055137 RepID=A0A2N5DRV4_9CAUL|nr:type II secretion system protein M [Caulobacter zeae]PLR28789.1 type II secretion system protein M [Caulobacter zeae]
MSRILETARPAWDGRTPRERVMLGVMAAAIIGVAGFYGVVAPLRHASDDVRERLHEAREQSAALRLASGAPAPSKPDSRPVAVIVEASAASLAVPIARKRQESDGAFTVWITAIDARALLPWAASLEREAGLDVAGFTASRLDNGFVEAEVTFARAAR